MIKSLSQYVYAEDLLFDKDDSVKLKAFGFNDALVANPFNQKDNIWSGSLVSILEKYAEEFPIYTTVFFHAYDVTNTNIEFKFNLVINISYSELFKSYAELEDNIDIDGYDEMFREKLRINPPVEVPTLKAKTNRGRKSKPITMVNGRLSEVGFEYLNKKIEELVADDPDPNQMKYAMWRVRIECKQTRFDTIEEILDFCAGEYNVDRSMLEKRNESRVKCFGYSKRM